MRIGLYSPYAHILGGGERYLFSIALLFCRDNQVDFFVDHEIKIAAEQMFGMDLSGINFVGSLKNKNTRRILRSLKIAWLTRKYDYFFYVTDGSLFYSNAKKNFLIIQVPQKDMYSGNLITKIKLASWHVGLVYSDYVKRQIEKWWQIKIKVLPPCINTKEFKSANKQKIILSVGRFFPLPHSKKQDVLIDVFKTLCQNGLKGWKLVLAGGVDKFGEKYYEEIKKTATGFPVEFFPNIKYHDLVKLYSESSIYWHAAGFSEDLAIHPERAEHFGITTLEAMSSSCVPVVFSAGGQTEIVEDQKSGFFWQKKQDLITITKKLIDNQPLLTKIASEARQRSLRYDLSIFNKELKDLIKKYDI